MKLLLNSPNELQNKGIYCIRNIKNNKVYIGSTLDCFRMRYKKHSRNLLINKHPNSHLQASYNKYSLENFIFEIIEIVDDGSLIREKEKEYILKYNSLNSNFGYNKELPGAERILSEESKLKISNTLKEKYKTDVKFKNNFKESMFNKRGTSSWNKGLKCPNISLTRRNMFFKIRVFDKNKEFLMEFRSMLDLVEYTETTNNNLPITSKLKKADNVLRRDKIYCSLRTGKPYKNLYFERAPMESDLY